MFSCFCFCKTGLQPTGTVRYASTWVHLGYTQSRRDDLQSVVWILLYFIKGKLEWQGLQAGSVGDIWKSVGNMKLNFNFQHNSVPPFISQMGRHVNSLGFTSEPNYTGLIKMMKQESVLQNIHLKKTKYQWEEFDTMISNNAMQIQLLEQM